MAAQRDDQDIRIMTDREIVEYVTSLDTVTPLENELAHRLEALLDTCGDGD